MLSSPILTLVRSYVGPTGISVGPGFVRLLQRAIDLQIANALSILGMNVLEPCPHIHVIAHQVSISVAVRACLKRTASSIAISSDGLIDTLTLAVSHSIVITIHFLLNAEKAA